MVSVAIRKSLLVAATLLYSAVVVNGQGSISEVLPSGGIISTRRSVDTSILASRENKTCDYSGGKIVFGGPASLEQGDKYYFPTYRQRIGYYLILDYVNRHRCGITMNGKQYKIELQAYDDQSSMELVEVIARKMVHSPFTNNSASALENDDAVDLIVAGYSSDLAKPLSKVVAEYNSNLSDTENSIQGPHRLMMAAGSSLTSNFAGRPHVFTTVPPVAKFLEPAMEALGTRTNARTVAAFWEDTSFTHAVCAAAPALVEMYGMELVYYNEVQESPDASALEPVASELKDIDPDVVLTCVYDCIPWHQAMRNAHWSPKAQVFTICISQEDYKEEFGREVEHMMGVVNWDESVTAQDALTGWNSKEFADQYRLMSSDTVVQSAATLGAGMISVAIQAMEATNTATDGAVLAEYMSTHTFPTIMGNITFDENGQSALALVLVQINDEGNTEFISETAGDLVYPMPTWDGRDCLHLADCVRIDNHTCTMDGYCECPAGYTSLGYGKTARCVSNASQMAATGDSWSSPGVIFGIVAAGLVTIAIITWTLIEKKKRKNDAVWMVRKEELKFDDPPEIVGRGTFGLVLLAEYRGTEVAVKKVLPPEKSKGAGRSSKDSMEAQAIGSHAGSMASGTVSGSSEGLRSGSMQGPLGAHGLSSMSTGIKSGSASTTKFNFLSSGDGEGTSKYASSKSERRKLELEFISEMRYLSKLRHPCITTVMGAVIKKGEDPMLVMEYMYHGSLYDILHNNTMVLEGEILLPIMRDISSGLRFLHASKPQIIHGDLKAANILVDSKFRAKVADFGLSQKHKIGAAAGTPFWMAPELLRATSVNTAASDMYAYGIILYEVFSRRDPYEGEDPEHVLKLVADPKIQKRPPVPRGCPPLVEGLMSDCLVENPEERPSFEEVNMRLKRMDITKVETEGSRDRSTVSLFDIFPRHIAEALRDGKEVEPEHKDLVTIFFSDIVGFTTISSTLEPRKVALMLDRLYTKFDDLSHQHDIFKVETIGDAYMAVTNLVKDQNDDHAKRIAEFAIDAIKAANETPIDADDPSKGCVNIRVGFHCGPVVADVVGNRNPRYCLFGDTVGWLVNLLRCRGR